MIRFHIVERPGANLQRALTAAMRAGELRTFKALKRGRKIEHITYPGWMNWSSADGVISCTVLSPRKPGQEWQLFSAFLGRLAARYADSVVAIEVQFPDAAPSPKKTGRRKQGKKKTPRRRRRA
ncbi:MAG TPA: hypothetical protein VLB75_04310 [Steroidobacteraceae bacterium]|nr:hypothetical protein [Steroidobacteraceae bacterium]